MVVRTRSARTNASKRSAAFVLLVVQTVLGLDDDEALESIVGGSGNFAVDALHFEHPLDGEITIAFGARQVSLKP